MDEERAEIPPFEKEEKLKSLWRYLWVTLLSLLQGGMMSS